MTRSPEERAIGWRRDWLIAVLGTAKEIDARRHLQEEIEAWQRAK